MVLLLTRRVKILSPEVIILTLKAILRALLANHPILGVFKLLPLVIHLLLMVTLTLKLLLKLLVKDLQL